MSGIIWQPGDTAVLLRDMARHPAFRGSNPQTLLDAAARILDRCPDAEVIDLAEQRRLRRG